VYFSYDGSEDYVISNLNLSFQRGKHYAFVGSSGSGKSTVVKLIIGLLQPNSGSVLYDNQEWEDIGIECIRASIAYVSQDPFIFSASFKDNVSMYSPTVSDEQVWKALASAEIANEVAKYPDTIYHQLADAGSDLSGGQRQRLEISRALVNGPSILILDEATSSLDVASEARILKNLLSQGITIISIAHRLVAAMESDHIYVFDKGVIIEQGSPAHLIQKSASRFSQLSKDEQL
jgi:ATP-binding cassette subfamily B protein